MRNLLLASFALMLVAGCASVPPPAPKAPTSNVAETPDWASSAVAQEGDVEFTNVAPPTKAKAAPDEAAPAETLKVDSASAHDVQSTHLNAAKH